jgi:hypothetical protein
MLHAVLMALAVRMLLVMIKFDLKRSNYVTVGLCGVRAAESCLYMIPFLFCVIRDSRAWKQREYRE